MPNRMFDRDTVDRTKAQPENKKKSRRNRFVGNINMMYPLFEHGNENLAKDWATANNCLEHYNALAIVYGRELATTATMHNTWPPRIMDGLDEGLVSKIQEYHLAQIQTMVADGREGDARAYGLAIYGLDLKAIEEKITTHHWRVVGNLQNANRWSDADAYIKRNGLDRSNRSEDLKVLKQGLAKEWIGKGLVEKARDLIRTEKLGTDFLDQYEYIKVFPEQPIGLEEASRRQFLNYLFDYFEQGVEKSIRSTLTTATNVKLYDQMATLYGVDRISDKSAGVPKIEPGLLTALVEKIREFHQKNLSEIVQNDRQLLLDRCQIVRDRINQGLYSDARHLTTLIRTDHVVEPTNYLSAAKIFEMYSDLDQDDERTEEFLIHHVKMFIKADCWRSAQQLLALMNCGWGRLTETEYEKVYGVDKRPSRSILKQYIEKGELDKARAHIGFYHPTITQEIREAVYGPDDHIGQYGVKNMKWGATRQPVEGATGVFSQPAGVPFSMTPQQIRETGSLSENEPAEGWLGEDLKVTEMNDSVNHPSHYTAYKGVEVIDLTEQMNFNKGNAVKYICRAGLKDPDKEVEDLRKAAWYIEREIKRLEDSEWTH